MKNIFLTETDVLNYIEKAKPLILKDYQISRETEDYFISILEFYLKSIGKEKIFDHLSYCLRELINNGKKANTKRVFFNEEKLEISEPEQYEKGMKLFKTKTISNIEYYLDLQEKKGLFVQVYYHIKDPYLNIIISNNSTLQPQERERILSKITHAKTFNSIEDAFNTVLDDTEGAGLGIVIMILMLRKIGIFDKNFAIVQENNMTHVRIAVPLSLVTEEDVESLSEVLVKEINTIPQFPENIRILGKMIESHDVDFKQVSELIRKDPGLTIDILKMSNSAHYRRLNKIEKIELAVNIIGAKGLKYMLQSYGIKKAMEEKYDAHILEQIWKHSYEVAKISSILCDKYNLTNFGEQSYIGGLLHDIGMIVLKSLHEKTLDKIAKFCMNKNISMNIIDNLLEGANHFQIGAKMTEKWGVPQHIIDIIKAQSNPFGAEEDVRKIAKIVYLANIIANKIDDNNFEYLSYESMIVNDFKIPNESDFKKLVEEIRVKIKDK
ncbi:MAG: hypothetical protein A2015_01615 [Spirochaetes bacterium GWF1_31_7]|nr:MAG: hypothetical protein A2Y30_02980 [Spirochaetes bacterium GWE1_32_154]OHD49285.1 MAG: hypothetical protein A2015_01615 [Spirochaetes bacterium GWF1_31_7]OHD83444.1 MAG: hypothetical protein A2355_11755 [Spirochaetes bacterium RIFOXYB1_FULL_32_8]HBD92976.1 hypothetical protein [Spirochaetia bacterium]HBI37638.1 hypothetical protein [Spirochaetia bacterium]